MKQKNLPDESRLPGLLVSDPDEGMALALRLYGSAVRLICRNVLSDLGSAVVEDAVSDSFTAIWRSADRFDPSKGCSFRSYCCGVARNTALKARRHLTNEPLLPLEEDLLETVKAPDLLQEREEAALIRDAIAAMEEPDRSVFLFRYLYFFRVKEIAGRLSLSPKKVENILFRRKKELELLLKERGVDYE